MSVRLFSKDFQMVHDILYHGKDHIHYNSSFLNGKNNEDLLRKDIIRINLGKQLNEVYSPRYLFLTLYSRKNKVKFGIYDNNEDRFKWKFSDENITNLKYPGLFLQIKNNRLILSEDPCKWEIINGYLKNLEHNIFITCDLMYKIRFTPNVQDAIKFYIFNGSLHYIKPALNIAFEYNNLAQKISTKNLESWQYYKPNKSKIKNVGILLAGGTSSRFSKETPKQLYQINSQHILTYSLDVMLNKLDKIIIVSNTLCFGQIKEIVGDRAGDIKIVINDFNCRLQSINTGLDCIKENYDQETLNVIIHDSARPFITEKHIETLLLSNRKGNYLYSQYCLQLVNGLLENNTAIPNRNNFVELCTPLCINYDICYFIFKQYINGKNRITYEFIPILHLLKIKYNLINGSSSQLRKITTKDDLDIA